MVLKHKIKVLKKEFRFLGIIIALIIVVIALFLISKFAAGTYSFEIEDKCGKFMNLMQHSIETETICKTRCVSQCNALNYNFKKIEFIEGIIQCNRCTCYCRK